MIPLERPSDIAEGSFTARYIELHGLLERMPDDEELRRRVMNNCVVLMIARGVASYSELAEKIGVQKPTISMFFSHTKGRQQVMLFVRIAAALRVPEPLDLFTRDLVREGIASFEASS